MKRYNEYKDSGVEWIGEIPSHWEVKRNKYIYKLSKGKNPSELVDTMGDNELPYLSMEYLRTGKNEQYARINTNCVVVEDNELLLLCDGSNSGEFVIARKGIVSSTMAKVINIDEIENRYSKYIFKVYETILKENTVGMGIPHVNTGFFRDSLTLIPTRKEQNKIANYLDKKTSQIETLISKKEELIKTLKASRTKLISETVTKGIDKNVPMKDSGIEWIGDIPKNYKIKNLRYLGNLQNGISKGAEEFGFGYPFVSYGDVYKNSVSNEVEGLVNSSKEDRRIYSVIEGDVFFTRTSETIEEIGFSSICLETIPDATFAGFLIRFRPNTNDLYKGYSKYYFRSDIHRKFFVKEMNLVTRASLGQNLLKNLPVVIPSYEEQIEISKYLDKQVTIINNSISKIEEQIELLKKAKQKLITEVVTGKIDVTNL